MLNLTTNLQSVPVAVNPKTVTHVTQAPSGATIHFTSGSSIHVKNDYLEVVGQLVAMNRE
jgi:uncharacterized protein YlzI (FlbEa/FlbD family)